MIKKQSKIKLIYNPNAGKKRALLKPSDITIEGIESMLKQYQLEVDLFPTKGPKHATELAKNAIKEGYQTVLAAGGDGTVSEVANGLVGSKVILGILPLGTFMNIARMLSVPVNLEAAVAIIKIGRTRKIDVGSVTKIDGDKLTEPFYFLETAGIGLDADLQDAFKEFEKGDFLSLLKAVKIFLRFISEPIRLETNAKKKIYKSTTIEISNGPYTGAALHMAPTAKLNDHKLTLSVFKMSRNQILRHFINKDSNIVKKTKKIEVFQADSVKVLSVGRHVHADASLFGYSPVSFKIVPNALEVICGFPISNEITALEKRTPLDP